MGRFARFTSRSLSVVCVCFLALTPASIDGASAGHAGSAPAAVGVRLPGHHELSSARILVGPYMAYFQAHGFTPNSTVTATLYANALGGALIVGPLTANTDEWGWAGWGPPLEPQFDSVPGNLLVVRDDVTRVTRELVVEQLVVTACDPAGDRIAGLAEPDQSVLVTVDEAGVAAETTATANGLGEWSVDVSGVIDFQAGMSVRAWAFDADGDITEARGCPSGLFPPGATIDACTVNDWVSVHRYPPNSTIFVEIRDSSMVRRYGPAAGQTDGNGEAWIDGRELGFDLQPGDLVQVRDEPSGGYKSLILMDATVDVFDTVGNVVGGTADRGTEFMVVVGDAERGSSSRWVTAGPDRRWTADFGQDPVFDFDQYMGSTGFIYDGDGEGTIVQLGPQPMLRASVNMAYLGVGSFPPNERLTIEVNGVALDCQPQTYPDGSWNQVGPCGYGLQTGDHIQVSAVGVTKELQLEAGGIDGGDAATDTVWGHAAVGRRLRVQTVLGSVDVTADGEGQWVADFGSVGVDLTPEMLQGPLTHIYIILIDEDFDQTDIYYEPDGDGDGIIDANDNAPSVFNPDQRDIDEDGLADVIDLCPSEYFNTCDVTGSAAVSMGPQGGNLETPDGSFSLAIPAGALSTHTSLSISDGGSGFMVTTDQGQIQAVLKADIGPSGTSFANPITITFHWQDADSSGIVDGTTIPESTLLISKDGAVIGGPCTSDPHCDMAANTFALEVSSLGTFVLGAPWHLYFHGAGPTANPTTLFLDSTAPTATTARYCDSAGVNFRNGNPWREIGTWRTGASLAEGALTAPTTLTVWLGLENSDDQGTNFDLRVEVYNDATLVASGEAYCITGLTRNPSLAREVATSLTSFFPGPFDGSTDALSLRVLTRIGSDGAGHACGGHSNAVGLRLYFDAVARPSSFDATFSP